MSVRI